jgi:hypothetical protein
MTALLMLALGISGYYNYKSHLEYKCDQVTLEVKAVGACDFKGYCRVKYSDGSLDLIDRPLSGHTARDNNRSDREVSSYWYRRTTYFR